MGLTPTPSILDPSGQRLMEIMGPAYVSPAHEQEPIWEIQDMGLLDKFTQWIGGVPGHTVPYDERRIRLLTELLGACERTRLWCPDDPTGLFPGVRPLDTQSWEIPHDIDVSGLYEFLSTETWCMVGQHRHDVDFGLPKLDLFRLKRVDFIAVMRESNAAYLLYAFHDNEPWRLAINPDLGNSVR